MTEPTELDKLALDLERMKEKEAEAKLDRIGAEEALLKAVTPKDEGSVTFKENFYKVTVKSPVNRTIDTDAYLEMEWKLPPKKNPIVKKLSIDIKKYRTLEEHEPDMFALLSKCITSKPGKIQVSVERREK